MSPSDPSPDSPPHDDATVDRSTAHVGLICTHAGELRPLAARLDRRRRYQDSGIHFTGGFLDESTRVAIVEAGSGFAAHRRATQILVREHHPAWVIAAGFSSALAADVRAGELSLATSIQDTHGQQLDVACPIPEARHATRKPHLVCDRQPRSPDEKSQLCVRWAAAAADTSSLAAGQVCRETETRFLSIRAILDDVGETMPDSALEAFFEPIGPAGRNPVHRWLSGIRQSPDEKLWAKRAESTARNLGKFLSGVVRQLGEHARRRHP